MSDHAFDTAPLLTYRECAQRLHVSVSAVRRFGQTGRLEVLRLAPQTHRVRQSSLQQLIEESAPQRASEQFRAPP